MKRLGILTAGGDTPALNATIQGAVVRANQLRVELFGLIKGFNSLFNPRVPHVHLNPLFQEIPELDPTKGGTLTGSARDFVDPERTADLDLVLERLQRLRIEGLICVGGDGTLNGLQPLAERLPTVLAPKTIDNDLGLNHPSEPDEWVRVHDPETRGGFRYKRAESRAVFQLDHLVNYVTPGYATAVFVSASGVERIRTTAESHRRIAIIEVMGRHSGYIALGSAYGRPDIILVPEHPPSLYDPRLMKPSPMGIDYLTSNFTDAIGEDDLEHMRQTLFASGNLTQPYHSINTDINKRIRYLPEASPAPN